LKTENYVVLYNKGGKIMLLNSRQFADKCGVAPQTILDWVNRGILIPVKKEGTHFYFDDSQVVDVFKMKVKQYSRSYINYLGYSSQKNLLTVSQKE
jgi:predicted site-specific integrase-resolvase